jgi:hypothetical protein
MTEKLHIRIAPDGTIEVQTENIEPAEIAALIPVLESMLEARALAARTEPTRPAPARKQKTPILRR